MTQRSGWVAIVVTALILSGCSTSPRATPTVIVTPETHTYAYYLTGTAGGADVTYNTGSGTSQASDIALPLQNKSGTYGIQFTEADAPSFLYISAQNTGEDGELKCRIQMDDVVLAENTSSGAYAIVTCQASK